MSAVAFLRSHTSAAAVVFMGSFFGCVAYFLAWQLHHWPELPGFIILVGGLPWSWLWLALEQQLVNLNTVNLMQRPNLYVVSLAILASGFSFNCALVYLAAELARSKLRRRSQRAV
ncbi:MAG: hypothetical protein ACRESY_11030 [Steroidobacteraceae bacterium]